MQLATQTLCDLVSNFQQPSIKARSRIDGMGRINGDEHAGTIVPSRGPDEQHGARAVQDELPIGVPQEGPKLRSVSRRIDDNEIGRHGEGPPHDGLVSRSVPIRVRRDLHVRECRAST